MSKRQYLELMGIDVWRKRQPRTVGETSKAQEEQAASVAAHGQSGTALLADVRRSLQETADEDAPAQKPAVVQVPKPELVKPVEAAPEFYLAFNHFASLTMVNIYPGGFAGVPGNHQRFIATLYFAITGEKGGSELQEVRWPMLKSDRISQSREDARQVLGRHLQQCRPEILVFGADPAELLGVSEASVYAETVVRDRRLNVVEETESYFRDPVKRKDLWRFLSPLQQRVRG